MTLTRLFAIVLAFDVLGLIVAGSDDLGHALVSGTPYNAPFPFVAVQALVVAAALRHRVAAAVLTALCVISVVSGFSDGSYAADLSAVERIIQLGIVSATSVLALAAAYTVVRPRALAVG